jgi:TPR repeat protein
MKKLIRAARRRDAEAQFNLGVLYSNGLDDNGYATNPNRSEAIKWLKRAARQGLPRAQMKLAEVYADGKNIPRDRIAACAWFLAASQLSSGRPRHMARAGYEALAIQLTAAQLEEARRAALGRRKPVSGMKKERT